MNRGLAFDIAIASSISRNPKTSYQRSNGREGNGILIRWIGSGRSGGLIYGKE
jgi:hypothetical protein